MGGCEDKIGGPVSGSNTIVTCNGDVPTELFHEGDVIPTAGNGVLVKVVSVVPSTSEDEEGFACFDFYLGDKKLNDQYACVSSNVDPSKKCWSNFYKDYGVKILIRPPEKDGVPLLVLSDTKKYIKIPSDLYDECVSRISFQSDHCLRYVPNTKLKNEDELTVTGTASVFYPTGYDAIGAYYRSQLEYCYFLSNHLLTPEKDPSADISLRFLLTDDQSFSIDGKYRSGRLLGGNQILIYANSNVAKNRTESIENYSGLGQDSCYDGMVLHEICHQKWKGNEVTRQYFWNPLQEGLARFMENTYPKNPSPKALFDKIVHEGEVFEYAYWEGEQVNGLFRVDSISENEVKISQIFDNFEYEMTFTPGTIVSSVFDFSKIAVEEPDMKEGSVRLRILKTDMKFLQQMNLVCHENSYDTFFGLWIEDKFFRNEGTQGIDTGYNNPYHSLDGSGDIVYYYNTGACFFDGIKKMYDVDQLPFETFLDKLTRLVESYANQPVSKLNETNSCILDTIQQIADEDFPMADGKSAFDVKKYAEKFGYNDKKPWCNSLMIYTNGDNFGKQI